MNLFWNITWDWKDMCGPDGLHTWNDNARDFGICFQELCFQIPVYFLIAITSGYFIGYRSGWVLRDKAQETAINIRSFAVIALVFIPIIELYMDIKNDSLTLHPILYFVAGASCLAWLLHFGYLMALKHRLGPSSRGPTLQLMLWSLSFTLTIISLRSNILASTPFSGDIATLCCHLIYLLTLIPSSNSRPTYYSSCLVGSQHTHSEYTPLLPHVDDDVLGTAMQGSSWFSKLTFGWVEPLIHKGLENQLDDPEELFDVPSRIRSSYVGAKLDRALIGNVDNYQQFEEVPHEPFISSGYGAVGETVPQSSTPVTPTSRVLVRPSRRQNVTLLRALHSCFGLEFYSIGILKVISDMAGFAGPLLLNKLIIFIQDESIDMHYGYLYAAGLFGATLTSALANVHFNWLMSLIGLKMQGAIIVTVLNKTLSVTATELTKTFSIGEITNFMSTDTERIVNSCPSFHAFWSIPLQLFITLFLLYQQVGIAFLAGVAFSVILIPVNKLIANKIGQLSTELMRHKDERVSLMSDLLKGMKTVKLNVWEDYFIDKISEARTAEVRRLRGRKYLDAVCVVLWAVTPVLVAALTLGTGALTAGRLDAATVFTTVALINMLIAPLNAFPWVLNGLTEAWVSIKRIQKLLELPDMDPERYYDRLNTNQDEDKVIIIKDATFSWAKPGSNKKTKRQQKNKGKSTKNINRDSEHRSVPSDETIDNEPFMLRDINLEIYKGEFIGITGDIGSGKSSLLQAIIGEMVKKSGTIQIPVNIDSFGYVSQNPWLIRGTIRENILFGKPYDEVKYSSVLETCALTDEVTASGDALGESGATLSGGQRARLALARALYQDKEVLLLDDVFSSLDGRVGRAVSRAVAAAAAAGGRTVLLVAHAQQHLALATRVVRLHNGRVVSVDSQSSSMSEIKSDLYELLEDETVFADNDVMNDDQLDTVSRNSLNEEESMSQGNVSCWVLVMYVRAVGYALTLAIILSLILMQVSQNFTFLWLTYWVRSQNTTTLSHQLHDNLTAIDHGINAIDNAVHAVINNIFGSNDTAHVSQKPTQIELALPINYSNDFYLEVYFGLAGVNVLFTIMRAFLFAYGGVHAAKKLHKSLLRVIVKAKMKFFDSTPVGRIMNRFSSDTYTADDSLPFILNILLAQFFSLIGALCVSVYGLPWLAAVVAPLVPLYAMLQRRYRAAARQLKRLQSVTLTPLYSHFNDTLQGSMSVRALGGGGWWRGAGAERAEAAQRAGLGAAAAAQWLAVRLQAAAVLLTAAAAAAAVLQRDTHAQDPGLVGLAISYSLSMTSMLSGVLSAFTETEREMIAVERIGEYIREVEPEKVEGDSPPYGWPTHGVVTFEDVELKYSDRESVPSALCGLSFETRPLEKLCIAGRTGAGKSSVLAALTRLSDLQRGRVLIDGVDIATLNLYALRSRIGVVPQSPFLLRGSVLDNVDPLRAAGPAAAARALERCGAPGALHAPAEQLSAGARQLLCVARVLLARPKVVLIDEATSSLDAGAEQALVAAVRSWWAGSTALVVAHRRAPLLACERALVLAAGRRLEMAPVDELLADHSSHLYALMRDAH